MTTINITYAPGAIPNAAEQADIVYAAAQWAMTLKDALTINVQVWAVDMNTAVTGLNAMCIPGIIQTVGLNARTLTRPQAKLSGDIANPHDPAIDLVVVIDTTTPWVLGTPPAIPIGIGQYSLATTIMHELCHGLGFVGLCDANPRVLPPPPTAGLGIYTAANTLLPLLTGTVLVMNPVVTIPAHFFPALPITGFAVMTRFANLFVYTAPMLTKGVSADDYVAFMTVPGSISIQIVQPPPLAPLLYIIETGTPFQPFTTCDHITGNDPVTGLNNLMNSSTIGLYLAAPDTSSRNILRAIGWNIP